MPVPLADLEQLTLDGTRHPSRTTPWPQAARFAAKVVADPRPEGCSYWTRAIGDDGVHVTAAGAILFG